MISQNALEVERLKRSLDLLIEKCEKQAKLPVRSDYDTGWRNAMIFVRDEIKALRGNETTVTTSALYLMVINENRG